MSLPRGIRNNNPGNIRYDSHTLWNGLSIPPSDGAFCRFKNPVYGLRAMSKLLTAYQVFHGDRSIRDLINRWAPPVENNTEAYIQNVANGAHILADAPIDVHNTELRVSIMKAIVLVENGQQPYADGLFQEAATMA